MFGQRDDRDKVICSRPFCWLFCWLICLPVIVQADQIDDYIKSQMQEQHIPGLSVAVVKEGRVVLAKGYGLASVELNAPATAETVYHLASLTKQFTAAAIMLLVQDGKLGLDDKINRYLENPPANWQAVTVRQLLTHTSGIKDYLIEMHAHLPDGTTPADIVAALGPMPLNFTPGAQNSYSNTGYLVLGMIIQKVSGKSYDEFMTERIFKPLGMTHTRRNSYDDIIPNRTAGYIWRDGKLHNSPFLDPALYDNADDGLLSSVLDLARWDAALYGDSPLTASSRTQMWSPVKLNNGSSYPHGLGWILTDVNGHRLAYHYGIRADSSTFIGRFVDDKLTVIVLANLCLVTGAQRIAAHIAGLYRPDLRGRDFDRDHCAERLPATSAVPDAA
ncbi:MAG TPA: serine hydrolase domain-containing protein [Blastocatellia bacterium]|nr:serine hydrolase domain-containing protein [Blastocatellia bacterium]